MAPPARYTRNNSSNSDSLTVDQKLDLLLNDVADIKDNNRQFKIDISEIKDDIKQFKNDISASLDMCFSQIKGCETTIENNNSRINHAEIAIQNLSSENNSLKQQVTALQEVVRSAEQYSRSNCLEIHGVPEVKSENIMDVVKRVARVLHFELRDVMVDAVHRLSRNPSKPQAHRGIIIKFCRRLDMEELRSKTRVKNGFSAEELGFQSDSKVFVNLSLTRDTRVLWAETRQFKRQHDYKYAWITSAGKVFLRKQEGARAVLITSKNDLSRLH